MNASPPDGVAIVYCDGAFSRPDGKTAHGLVRFTRRYRVAAVIDAELAGQDAGTVLDGRPRDIPIVLDLEAARAVVPDATHFVIGLAPDGGRLPARARAVVSVALEAGLDVDSGLHDFLSEDPVIGPRAAALGRKIRDVRKPPHRDSLHHFSNEIENVDSVVIAVLGTDSACGKRTTAWMLVDALQAAGRTAEMIGTGQTAWMQGARHGFILDSTVNDFVAGEIAHAVLSAWRQSRPDFIIIEGQGGLMNPAYPGGVEILAAGRPRAIVLQIVPGRVEYDGFPGYAIQPLDHQIRALEMVGNRPVIALTVNHEGIEVDQVDALCRSLAEQTGLVCCDPVVHGVGPVVDRLLEEMSGAG